jgi:cell division protein FtsW (lipid II flippase)
MGVTYTAARDRDQRARRVVSTGRGDAVLLAMVAVSALLIVVCYLGRSRTAELTDAGASVAMVNLSTVTEAAQLEPAMALAFELPSDRRLAARELYRAIHDRGEVDAVANVGALSRLRVSVSLFDRLPPGSAFAGRRQPPPAGEPAAAPDAAVAATAPLFTAAELAAIKPGLTVRTRTEHRSAVAWSALAFLASFVSAALVGRFRRVPGDPLMLAAALLLTTLGFLVMLGRPDPLRDTILVVRYTQGVVAGLVVFLAASLINVRSMGHLGLSYLPLAGAMVLAVLLIGFGTGPGTSGARINLGPVQPMELIRLLLVLFLAGYFARRWELVRQLRSDTFRNHRLPAWLNLPRLDHVLPVVAAVAVSLVLFFALKDLGPALLLSLLFLTMFAVARGHAAMAAVGLAVLVAGFYAGHTFGLSSTLSSRVAMWQAPWENVAHGGDQVAQALWALASGAVQGSGLGLGATRYVPAGHTDLALAALAEELGAAGVLAVLAAFSVMAWRGLRLCRRASTDYGFFLALGMTLLLVIPALVIGAGMLGVIPLTGVVTPFVSYGGSAMVINFAALGLLVACAGSQDPNGVSEPFVLPLRWLGRSLAATTIVLFVVWARVQVVSADEFLVRPQLGRQADGGVRFQYNPRVLDAARLMPRGTVFDRAGVPLATSDLTVARAEDDVYRRMRITLDDVCPTADERCYPLGGEAFHLLGDARTRANWAASNSSYVERDAEASLRGFDDRAMTVDTREVVVVGGPAVRRDYAPLVALVRHRWEPDHPDVAAVFDRSRDVRLTVDARLQHQVAGILARAVTGAGVTKGAAVVVDATTGEVLASVSYPWPTSRSAVVAPDAALDRARYGLYPPGSTFKLVTSAAALREDPSLAGLSFVCSRLPDGRVGARLPGYGRPVRDDDRDHTAHGAISMRDGIVRSCNAYFAQLAVRLGADALAATSGLAGIALAPSADANRLRDNLPHAAYGQGQVVTTPLRMARVAAAIGSDGMIREAPLVQGSALPPSTQLLPVAAARTLSGFMRGAVTAGTGRLLAQHPLRIAGKTGTAETDTARSHAWFVGFAPHGAATRQIAFAVILENAGYGGSSAAAASGQIVTAAASLGLVQ